MSSEPSLKEREAAATFIADFKAAATAIRNKHTQLATLDAAERDAAFQEIDRLVESLRDSLNQATVYLGTYDTQKSMEELKSLEEATIQAKAALNPQKKFAFKSKKKPATGTTSSSSHPPDPSPAAAAASSSAAFTASPPAPLKQDSSAELVNPGGAVFKDLNGSVIKHPGRNQDVAFSNVQGCQFTLTEPTTAVRVNQARGCRFVFAPVGGSVFLEDCHDCVFVIACHQLRIHDTTASKLYVHVTSKPIIEDCHGLLFAPDPRQHDAEVQGQLVEARLDPGVNFWDQVEDFKWLRQTKSPNWGILSEDQREAL